MATTIRPSTFAIEYDDASLVAAAQEVHGEHWYDHMDPIAVRASEDAGDDLHCAKARCTQLMKQHKAIVLRKYEVECDTFDGVEMCWREDYTTVNGWWE